MNKKSVVWIASSFLLAMTCYKYRHCEVVTELVEVYEAIHEAFYIGVMRIAFRFRAKRYTLILVAN